MRAHQLAAQPRGRPEERLDEVVGRPVVDLARAPPLLDPSLVEDRDVVGDVERLLLVVRDQHRRHAGLGLQATQPLPQVVADLGVERAERLVEQQHLRLDGERPRERHPLALAARQLRRVALLVAGQADDLQQLVDAPVDLGLRPPADRRAEADVVAHVEVLERGVVLEDEADLARLRRHERDVLSADHDGPGVGNLEPGDRPQQRRLAGARRAEQRGQRAAGDRQVDVAQRVVVAVALVQPGDDDRVGLGRDLRRGRRGRDHRRPVVRSGGAVPVPVRHVQGGSDVGHTEGLSGGASEGSGAPAEPRLRTGAFFRSTTVISSSVTIARSISRVDAA